MKNQKIRILVEGAVMVALATVLSFIKIFEFPWGGSITLFSMLPIVVFALRYGTARGLGTAFVFSLVQFGLGMMSGIFGWGLTPAALVACIFLDYIGAFTVIGLAGVFGNKSVGRIIAGIALALSLRFALHIVSGAAIFGSFGLIFEVINIENTWLYSTVYNAAFMLPEIAMTMGGAAVLFGVPAVRKILVGESK